MCTLFFKENVLTLTYVSASESTLLKKSPLLCPQEGPCRAPVTLCRMERGCVSTSCTTLQPPGESGGSLFISGAPPAFPCLTGNHRLQKKPLCEWVIGQGMRWLNLSKHCLFILSIFWHNFRFRKKAARIAQRILMFPPPKFPMHAPVPRVLYPLSIDVSVCALSSEASGVNGRREAPLLLNLQCVFPKKTKTGSYRITVQLSK